MNSVLSSIETGKISENPPQSSVRASAPGLSAPHARTGANRSGEQRATPSQNVTSSTAGQKRKAEGELRRPDNPYGRDIDRSSTSKDAPLSTLAARSRQSKTPVSQAAKTKLSNTNGASTTPKKPSAAPSNPPSKPPLKGSYADMMRLAKEAQQKAPMQVGMIKHQSVPKQKLSKAERKKQALEMKEKQRDAKLGKKPSATTPSATQKGGAPGLIKKREREESSYKGTARPTATPAAPAYKGTAGLASRGREGSATTAPRDKARSRQAPARRDDYLGTDEEDEGEGYYDDYDDGYSDESSDMEAGIVDVEEEEQGALQWAKREDEMELKAEMAAKKEKLERKKRLAELAAKTRR